MFKSLVRQLAERRTVTAGDGDLIAIYCSTKERWLQALEAIRTQGVVCQYERLDADGHVHTMEKPNINLKIAEVSERSMVTMLTRLGMTPKDRESVKPTLPAKPPKNAPPHPDSIAGIELELQRLRALQAAEESAEPEPPATTEHDLDELLKDAEDIQL
jgi:P27 family predicted phage terminase small subunit